MKVFTVLRTDRMLIAAMTVSILVLSTLSGTATANATVTAKAAAQTVATVATVATVRPRAAHPTTATATPLGRRVAVGAYVDGMDTDPALLDQFDQTIGKATTVASIFRGYGDIFPSTADIALTDNGQRSLLVAWYLDVDRFTGYISGAHDAYLTQEADAVRAHTGIVYIRPWAEMNGDWQDFQPTASGSATFGGTPAEFVAAWQHVVNVFRAEGATNVRWVFNPTADTYAQTTDVATIWPGAAYVDVLGIDGYNWGNGGGLVWTAFTDIFYEQYTRLTALDATAPVWICEFGSKEAMLNDGAPVDPNDSKAQWYADAFATTAFARITTLVAFDADKERDWLVTSSPAVVPAIRAGLGE